MCHEVDVDWNDILNNERKKIMNKRSFSSLVVEPVSAYLELTVSNPIKNLKEVGAERGRIGRVRKDTTSLIKIVRSQRTSPEVEYQMKSVRAAGPARLSYRPAVTVIA